MPTNETATRPERTVTEIFADLVAHGELVATTRFCNGATVYVTPSNATAAERDQHQHMAPEPNPTN
jgi:hypothetical protein